MLAFTYRGMGKLCYFGVSFVCVCVSKCDFKVVAKVEVATVCFPMLSRLNLIFQTVLLRKLTFASMPQATHKISILKILAETLSFDYERVIVSK